MLSSNVPGIGKILHSAVCCQQGAAQLSFAPPSLPLPTLARFMAMHVTLRCTSISIVDADNNAPDFRSP